MFKIVTITCFIFSLAVHYRIFAMTPSMEPVEKNVTTKTDGSIVSEIVVFDSLLVINTELIIKTGNIIQKYLAGSLEFQKICMNVR